MYAEVALLAVFVFLVWNQGVAGRDLLAMRVVCTVTLSIFAHANPLARRLGPRMES